MNVLTSGILNLRILNAFRNKVALNNQTEQIPNSNYNNFDKIKGFRLSGLKHEKRKG